MAVALGGSLSVGKLLGAEGYWFLQAILIYYVLEYVLLKLAAGFRGGYFGLNMVRSFVDNNSSRILLDAKS